MKCESLAEESENGVILDVTDPGIVPAAEADVPVHGTTTVGDLVPGRLAAERAATDRAAGNRLCTGTFLRQGLSTSLRFNTRRCKQPVRFQPILPRILLRLGHIHTHIISQRAGILLMPFRSTPCSHTVLFRRVPRQPFQLSAQPSLARHVVCTLAISRLASPRRK